MNIYNITINNYRQERPKDNKGHRKWCPNHPDNQVKKSVGEWIKEMDGTTKERQPLRITIEPGESIESVQRRIENARKQNGLG